MHVGNLRTALYAYLIAKQSNGAFVLRIEDTDRSRFIENAMDVIYKTLSETGLKHDEGPDVGGDYGPYIQSERMGLYSQYARQLIQTGHAYYCFCQKDYAEEISEESEASKAPPKYDRKCFTLSKKETEKKLAEKKPYVIRQKIPDGGVTTFADEVYGSVTVANAEIEDQILIKSDGYPTYNFANVIDDHLMNITHIIRGSEYLSSTPKYNLLYEAFGWEIPKYVHCPPVMKDARHKLSKRSGDASYEDLVKKGYLTPAILNYIALLGWSPGGEQEKFTLEELVEAFGIKGISKSPAIFDTVKLDWLNGEYIKALVPDEFFRMAKPYLEQCIQDKSMDLSLLSALLQKRCAKMTELCEQADFFNELPDYDVEMYIHKKMKTTLENSKHALIEILSVLERLENWTVESIHTGMMDLAQRLDVKNGRILWPLRTAVSGKAVTPGGGAELAYLLGKDESVNRVKRGIERLNSNLTR
jgi:glutamyl-tRNA synthetase